MTFYNNCVPLLIGILSATVFTPNCVYANPSQEKIQAVVNHLVGIMDTSAQAAQNPKKSSVRMITCQVKITDPTDSVYLYQEQALSNNLGQPYRQRFLEIKISADGQMVESKSYKPSDPQTSVGLCSKSSAEKTLSLSAIGEYVCSVLLTPIEEGYQGETPPGGCRANVRGAVKINNTIILHSTGMDTWDRGYDEAGNQVWGAENEGYQYRWVK